MSKRAITSIVIPLIPVSGDNADSAFGVREAA